MARRRKTRKTYRRRSGGGGGRLSINFNDAALAAAAGFVGNYVKGILPTGTPTFITGAPASALGLYAIGVFMKNKAARSFGAGLALGETVAGVAGP